MSQHRPLPGHADDPLPDPGTALPTPPEPGPGTGLDWRPVVLGDLTELTALVARAEEAERAPQRTDREELAEWLAAPWHDLAADTRIGVDAGGVPRAWIGADLLPGHQRVVRCYLDGVVDPQWSGRGIGTALVAWAAARGRQQLAASGAPAPGRIAVQLRSEQEAAARVYRRAGFTPIRYWAQMRRDLAEPLPIGGPVPGVRIEPWSDRLDDAVRLAHNEAFADHWGSEPRTPESWQVGRAMFAPQWSRIAVDEDTGEIAGYAISARYPQDWPINGWTGGVTELLGVRRPWRGRGVAVALLIATMRAYRAGGMQYAELDVDTANPSGAGGLYASLGYRVLRTSAMFSLEVPAPGAAGVVPVP